MDKLVVDPILRLLGGGGALRRLALSLGGGEGGGGDDNDNACKEEALPLVVLFVEMLLVMALDIVGLEFVLDGGGGMTRPGPFVGKNGVPSESEEEYTWSIRWPTCWIPEVDNELLPDPPDVREAALPFDIGLVRPRGLIMLALRGDRLPALLGVVTLDPVDPELILPPLPRGTKLAPTLDEAGGLSGTLAVSSTEPGTLVLGFLGLLLNKPIPLSALPSAYGGRVLLRGQQLHPVNSIPRLHAPIRPAKGILPML